MPLTLPDPPCQIHASCVCLGARALLIIGPSGSGKSALSVQLMAYGAELIADDRCDLSERQGRIFVSRPPTLPSAIEARGLGLLAAHCVGSMPLAAVLDLSEVSTQRLPPRDVCHIGSHAVPLLRNVAEDHFPAAVYHYLKHGFSD